MKQPQVTKDLDNYQAITIPIKDTPRLLKEPISWDYHSILLNYVYVIEINSFVNIDKPQLIIHKTNFDETFETLKMPRGVTPSSYVRDLNNETRKVYSMQMNCTTSKRIYTSDDQIKYLNIYKPAPIPYMENSTYQKPKRLLNHLDYILNKDPLAIDHVLKWITHLVFKPEIRMAHGLMISGDPRTGKSFFANLIELLIGKENFLKIDPDNLTAKFKDAILGKRVLIVEELKNRTDPNLYNKLKVLFTNPTLQINRKGVPEITIDNFCHWVFFSNHAQPIAFEKDESRLFYLHSIATKMDQSYYTELYHWLESTYEFEGNNSIASIYYYLKKEILPKLEADPEFSFRTPYQTMDHKQAVLSSDNQLELYIKEQLELKRKGTYFEKGAWFTMSDFLEDLPPQLSHMKKNNNFVQGVLKSLGLRVLDRRLTISKIKVQPYYFSHSDRILNDKYWEDRSVEGLRRRAFRRITSPQQLFTGEHNVNN